jgi:hypothetical protein
MSKHKKVDSSALDAPVAPEHVAGYPGPGYAGFGGSAGYSGSGQGGISGGYAGAGYGNDTSWTAPAETRHDDRIREDVRSRLDMSDEVGANAVEVEVEAGEVTLRGNVETRHMKHIARDIAESVHGVTAVHNELHVEQSWLEELKEKVAPEPHQSRHR